MSESKDDGMLLEAALVLIPAGSTVILCPADKDMFLHEKAAREIEAQFEARDIRAIVLRMPFRVWAVTNESS